MKNLVKNLQTSGRSCWLFGISIRTWRSALLILVLWSQVSASDIPLAVEDSGNKEVDALVLHLVSARPAPHPSGYTGMTAEEDMSVPYMTPGVSNAIWQLKAMGTGIFPALVKHLRDDRYSFSDISSCWANLSVGDAVLDVLSDGHYMVPGYKFRKTPSGSAPYLTFKGYVEEREPVKWASWARSKSRLDIQLDFIDWCVTKENERGFTDAAQKEGVLARYTQAREEAVKNYSEPNHATKGGQPIGFVTNQDPASAGSRR